MEDNELNKKLTGVNVVNRDQYQPPKTVKVGKSKTKKPYIYYLRTPEDYKYIELELPEYLHKPEVVKLMTKTGVAVSEKVANQAMKETAEILIPIMVAFEESKYRETWTVDEIAVYMRKLETAIRETLHLAKRKGVIK